MSRTITFIRHAETAANAERRWQGSTNAPFTATGDDQIARLGRRFSGADVGRLVASDLPRTASTAAVLGEATLDPAWREFHVGAWEGLTSDEVRQRFPGEMDKLFTGEDFAIGGGEMMSDFRARIDAALDALAGSLDDGEQATVVTHGGVIWAIANRVLAPATGSAPLIPSHNTAVSRVRIDDDGAMQLTVFNDATHLDSVPTQFGPEGTPVTLIRHGQTSGNVEGRWQGRSDSPLTDHGIRQVEAASRLAPTFDALYTSPLGRTAHTAQIIGGAVGVPSVAHDGLVEMSFGTWENLTSAEAAAAHPDLFEAVYGRGEDHRRGGDGESFTEAGERLAAAIAEIVATDRHADVGLVSHGAAIRAYATLVVGLGFPERNRLPVPRNSSMSKVVYAEGKPVLASYNVAPHLD